MRQARCTTASAPANSGSSSSRPMSALAQVAFGSSCAGGRRAIPSKESILVSATSARRRLVPMLPLAPVTTTRIDFVFAAPTVR